MAGKRIRSIKPEWLEDERLATCSDTARMLSVALIVLSDDYGNGRAHQLYLASSIWPYDSSDARETLATLSRALDELVAIGFIRLYRVNKQAYYTVVNWRKHQRVDRPSQPLVPGPDLATEPFEATSACVCRDTLASLSRDTRAGLDQDRRGEEVAARACDPSTPEQCQGPTQSTEPATTPNGSSRVTGRHAAIAWQRVLAMPGGNPGAVHTFELWQIAFETIAAACNVVEGKPELALQVVTEWFWIAPEGPVQAGRISRSTASPKHLAKLITQDLDHALEWWTKRKQSTPAPQEAAQP